MGHLLPDDPHILLTGATGYVGGRLLARFEQEARRVRCLVRRKQQLTVEESERITAVQGDLLDPDTLPAALEGIDVAYYLVHLMGAEGDFEALDQQAARNFATAARAAGVKRIIYLGGLGEESEDLSPHLRSRQEVGRILRESGATVLEFRASIILGTKSLSFEMIRALVERLPIMITPRWVRVQAQPILITDVLQYLEGGLTIDLRDSQVVEIGGADACSYGDLMQEYAAQRGLRRWFLDVPFLTPKLSSLWLGLITPVYARVGRELISSIRNATIVTTDDAARLFPGIQPLGVHAAVERVLRAETTAVAQTSWSDARSSGGRRKDPDAWKAGPRLLDKRAAPSPLAPAAAFVPIRRIGGTRGWYYASWLWRLRGFVDLLVGGVGLRRGRRDPDNLRVGEALDFWRVEDYEPDRRLLLRAEMKVPGRAWLELEVEPVGAGSLVHQTAVFDPRGVLGRLYWWGVWPLHALIFRGMLKRIVQRGLEDAEDARAAANASGTAPAPRPEPRRR